MACVFLAVALAGFSTTFFIPLARGSFTAPPVIFVHAVLVFGWLLLLILQSSLVQQRRIATHRQFGIAGVLVALGVVVSGLWVGYHATRRDLANGGGDFVLGQLVNFHVEMLLFGALVAAAMRFRKRGDVHKRLMVLATISALAPAWLRFRHFMPFVPEPFITFSVLADAMLLVFMARDWRVLGRVHPTYLWAGGAMVAVHATEILAIRSEPWLALARWLLDHSPV